MKQVNLIKREHKIKIGQFCPIMEPNVTEDSVFFADGEVIGFYIRDIKTVSERMASLANVANAEFLSERVPKTMMDRKKPLGDGSYLTISQYSTIIGAVPPKPHMRRNYPTMSSVHAVKSAAKFIKAMLLLCKEGEAVVKEIMPHQYEQQRAIISSRVPEKWRFGSLFTSSISNFNIPAPFHRDAANIPNTVNIIISKKNAAEGGHLHIPDYGATIYSGENSLTVYPAWRNVHGVTPIETTTKLGYRNSLVFYPLRAFMTTESP